MHVNQTEMHDKREAWGDSGLNTNERSLHSVSSTYLCMILIPAWLTMTDRNRTFDTLVRSRHVTFRLVRLIAEEDLLLAVLWMEGFSAG